MWRVVLHRENDCGAAILEANAVTGSKVLRPVVMWVSWPLVHDRDDTESRTTLATRILRRSVIDMTVAVHNA